MSTEKNPLIGKTIKAVFLADDQGAIKFEFSDGTSTEALCDGDCCSHTWIEDVINVGSLLGAEVLSVQDLDLPKKFRKRTKTSHYEGKMRYYGCAIKTSKGRCTLAYRNSSNGYYGGNLVWSSDDYFYGGVFGQNKSTKIWQPVKE